MPTELRAELLATRHRGRVLRERIVRDEAETEEEPDEEVGDAREDQKTQTSGCNPRSDMPRTLCSVSQTPQPNMTMPIQPW